MIKKIRSIYFLVFFFYFIIYIYMNFFIIKNIFYYRGEYKYLYEFENECKKINDDIVNFISNRKYEIAYKKAGFSYEKCSYNIEFLMNYLYLEKNNKLLNSKAEKQLKYICKNYRQYLKLKDVIICDNFCCPYKDKP